MRRAIFARPLADNTHRVIGCRFSQETRVENTGWSRGKYFSPRHRRTLFSRNEGSKRVSMTWRGARAQSPVQFIVHSQRDVRQGHAVMTVGRRSGSGSTSTARRSITCTVAIASEQQGHVQPQFPLQLPPPFIHRTPTQPLNNPQTSHTQPLHPLNTPYSSTAHPQEFCHSL
jgi:hypothetical protein